jgi:hypothetical protein
LEKTVAAKDEAVQPLLTENEHRDPKRMNKEVISVLFRAARGREY